MDGKGYRFPIQMDSKLYFDGYDRQKTLWFDEFSGKTMQFTKFCQLTDRFGARYETKGGSVLIFGIKKILISTIQFPHLWWAGSERFNTDTEQLYRRLTKCYYLGQPRIKEDGTKEYAIPLEFNPRECCNTRDFEEILKRHVKYPSDLMEVEDPEEEPEEDKPEDKDEHEELIADITAKEKEIEELKRKLEELKQQMNDEEKPVEQPVEPEKPTQPPAEPELPDTSDDEDEMIGDLLKKKEREEKKPVKERPIKRRQSRYLFRGRSRDEDEDEDEDDYCKLIDDN